MELSELPVDWNCFRSRGRSFVLTGLVALVALAWLTFYSPTPNRSDWPGALSKGKTFSESGLPPTRPV